MPDEQSKREGDDIFEQHAGRGDEAEPDEGFPEAGIAEDASVVAAADEVQAGACGIPSRKAHADGEDQRKKDDCQQGEKSRQQEEEFVARQPIHAVRSFSSRPHPPPVDGHGTTECPFQEKGRTASDARPFDGPGVTGCLPARRRGHRPRALCRRRSDRRCPSTPWPPGRALPAASPDRRSRRRRPSPWRS